MTGNKKSGDGDVGEPSRVEGLADAKDNYSVGYGKPPVHSRFKPGQSGNPKGPPKGPRSLKALIQRALDKTIAVKSDGKRSKTTKRAATATQLVNAAVRGDPKAIKLLMEIEGRLEAVESTAAPGTDREARLDDTRRRVLDAALKRIADYGVTDDAKVEQEKSEDRSGSNGTGAAGTAADQPANNESNASAHNTRNGTEERE